MGIYNLIKLALIGLAVWVLYRGIRSIVAGRSGENDGKSRRGRGQRDPDVLDVMVQDPNCGTYLPQHQALRAVKRGQEHYFCSEKCRDEYLAGAKEKTK